MSKLFIASVLLMNAAFAYCCRGDQPPPLSLSSSAATSAGVSTNFQSYKLQVKSRGWITITNAPESNRVHIGFVEGKKGVFDFGPDKEPKDAMYFSLTDQEPHTVLVWNVRVQTKSLAEGTNGLRWETIHDDYPIGMLQNKVPTGGTEEFVVPHPEKTPWRVAIVYSIAWTDTNRYSGNYEVVSAELNK